MSIPEINFENIRPFDGSRHAEQMCCQLASLEPASAGEHFSRKGQGGDAGVECYRRRADGREVGWQAKYLFHWNDSLKNQLDHSIRTALNKHPNLVEYVVCLPFDLSDSRRCGGELLECQNRLFPKWAGSLNAGSTGRCDRRASAAADGLARSSASSVLVLTVSLSSVPCPRVPNVPDFGSLDRNKLIGQALAIRGLLLW